MWYDVVIGSGDKGNSSYRISSYPDLENVSENRTSYWVRTMFLGIGMTIFKNTKEGESLETMLRNEETAYTITLFLDNLALQHISREKLRQKIEDALEVAHSEGVEYARVEMRRALGLTG